MTRITRQLRRFDHSRSPTGYFPALLVQKFFTEPLLRHVVAFCEASAVLCLNGQAGRIIISGKGENNCSMRTAIKDALYFIRKFHVAPEAKVLDHLMGRPADVDFDKLLNHQDEPIDIIVHVPPYYNAAYLGPSLVLALVAMLWRLPPLKRWSAVGGFDLQYNLSGRPLTVPTLMRPVAWVYGHCSCLSTTRRRLGRTWL